MSISLLEDYKAQGVNIVSAGMTLLPIPIERITFLDSSRIEIDFSFVQPTTSIAYPNEISCVYFFDVEYPEPTERNFHSDLLKPDENNKIFITLPPGGVDALSTLVIGYSNGVFGGHGNAYYANLERKIAYYYNFATFDLSQYDYPVKHPRGERIVMRYDNFIVPKAVIYIGNDVDIVAYLDGTFTIGN